MNIAAPKNNVPPLADVKVGEFTKMEAAQFIGSGFSHIHSSPHLFLDPFLFITQQKIQGNKTSYPWEMGESLQPLILTSARSRSKLIDELGERMDFAKQTQNRDRMNIVLEEILTNSFYHSIKDPNGKDFFDRQQDVSLPFHQAVSIKFNETDLGIHLCVSDNGGSLMFSDLSQRFSRFFSKTPSEIPFDSKHSGAGLGLSLVFQVSTHLNIEVDRNNSTKISVWLDKSKYLNPEVFSFNFFEV